MDASRWPTPKSEGRSTLPDRPELGWLDRYLAAPMWCAGFASLICMAGALQDLRPSAIGPLSHSICWSGILMLWFLFPIEWGLDIVTGSRFRWYHLIYCIVPPLRQIEQEIAELEQRIAAERAAEEAEIEQ